MFLARMRLAKTAQTVFTPLADGAGVLLNVDTLVYYSLNRTAAAFWQEIESRSQCGLEDLVQFACSRFDIDEPRARQFLSEFASRLAEYKMVRIE